MARAAAFARAPTPPSSLTTSTASPASLNSQFDRLPDELIKEIGVHVYDEDTWSGDCDRSSIKAFSAAGRRFWTVLEPLRWKVLRIDTSTADFARLNVLLVETGRHVTRLHLTLDARYAYSMDQLTEGLRLLSSVAHFKLFVVVSQRGTDVPPQRLTEIYEALHEGTTRLKAIKLRALYDSVDFFAAGLAELLQQNTLLRVVDMRRGSLDSPPPHHTGFDNFRAALADLTEIRVAHLDRAVLSGVGQRYPQWPSLSYASFEIGFRNSALELDLILQHSRHSLRAIVLTAFSADSRVAEASGPLRFHQLETAVVTTPDAFSLFRQLVHVSSPVRTLYIAEVTSAVVQAVQAFQDDQPTKTLTRLLVPPERPWTTDVLDQVALRTLRDWAGPRGIKVDEADEDTFCDELQRRAWQGW